MTQSEIKTSIDSHKARLNYEVERAMKALIDDEFTIAAMAATQAAEHKGAIKELQFLLECMEVEA